MLCWILHLRFRFVYLILMLYVCILVLIDRVGIFTDRQGKTSNSKLGAVIRNFCWRYFLWMISSSFADFHNLSDDFDTVLGIDECGLLEMAMWPYLFRIVVEFPINVKPESVETCTWFYCGTLDLAMFLCLFDVSSIREFTTKVFTVLISNGVQFCNDGGTRITLRNDRLGHIANCNPVANWLYWSYHWFIIPKIGMIAVLVRCYWWDIWPCAVFPYESLLWLACSSTTTLIALPSQALTWVLCVAEEATICVMGPPSWVVP